MNGKVIGIHSRIGTFPPNRSLSENVHVPVDTFRSTWDRLVKGDVWGNGYVGFRADGNAKSCKVFEVSKGTPADKAGLKADDVILTFDGKKIATFEEFGERMREVTVGSTVALDVQRGDETVSLKVTIGKRNRNDLPDVPGDIPRDDVIKNSGKVLAAFRAVESKARQSTVKVLCDGKDTALGTIVGPDGWILTKLSELKGHTTTCKLSDGRELEAQVVGVHDLSDLALLKIDAKGLTAVEWQGSKVPQVGNWVATVGLGPDPIAAGVVSVGVRIGDPKQARPVRDRSKSGYLGVGLADAEDVVKIGEVMPGTAADKAGIKANDIVLLLNGKRVKDREDFIDMVGDHKPDEEITLKIKRGTEEKEFKVKLGRRPATLDRGELQNTIGGPLSARRGGFPIFLQHDTVLKPQDCGGPVVDLDGKVIGINIARAGRTETYTIPVDAVQPLLADLMSGKLAPVAKAPLSAAEAVAAAKAALEHALADKTAAEKKVADAKAALEKAEAKLKEEKEKEKAKTSK
jgi:serine protease Do